MITSFHINEQRMYRFLSIWTLFGGLLELVLLAAMIVFILPAGQGSGLSSNFSELIAAGKNPLAFRFAILVDAAVWLAIGGFLVSMGFIVAENAPIRAAIIAACGIAQVSSIIGSFLRLEGTLRLSSSFVSATTNAQQSSVLQSYLNLQSTFNANFDAGAFLITAAFILMVSVVWTKRGFPHWWAILLALVGVLNLANVSVVLISGGYQVTLLISVILIEIFAFLSSSIVFQRIRKNKRLNSKLIREDEIGSLASIFNCMSIRLRETIDKMERGVEERTQPLRHRLSRPESSSHSSQDITPILDIDLLLISVANLVCDTFEYSQVHIYLTDSSREQLVLRAESGKNRCLHHALRINSGNLNGKAALLNLCQLSNNVRQASNFLADESMPGVCSELVIPLHISDKVIGTMDILGQEANAFSAEEISIIQSLGGQIAIAIENARLFQFSQNQAEFNENGRAENDLNDSVIQSLYNLGLIIEGWRQKMKDTQRLPLEETLVRTAEINLQVLKEMRHFTH
jgi:putative methionine-R-sulfoxide reductase with GAF domain